MRIRLSSIFLAGLLTVVPSLFLAAQQGWYERAVDLVFPHAPLPPGWAQKIEYQLVLRVRPSFTPGFQYQIQKHLDGSFRVFSQTLASGQKNVWYSGLDWRARWHLALGKPKAAARQVAKRMIVCSESVEVASPAMSKIMHQFSRISISPLIVHRPRPDGRSVMYLDGTLYDLWFQSTLGEYHMQLHSGAGAERDDYNEIITWIGQMMQLVRSYGEPDPQNCKSALRQTLEEWQASSR